jgi:hypothetical protein
MKAAGQMVEIFEPCRKGFKDTKKKNTVAAPSRMFLQRKGKH